jgi:Flp pilus assembly protein TadG
VNAPIAGRPGAERPEGAHSAQIIIMFALFATALIGVLGLATDLGISFAGKRSMQNAADAAAYAGARQVARSATITGVSAWSDVSTMATGNDFALASGNPTVTCVYVNDADAGLGSCSGTVPSTATGVKVTVAETHPTFFIRAIPGAPQTATTSATAVAHVMVPALMGSGPFIVCATATVLYPNGSGTMDILNKVDGAWQLNTAAVGKTFDIHDTAINRCGNSSNSFKGIADATANASLSAPPAKYFGWATGDVASITSSVEGIQGCQAGQEVDNCVAYLPISVIDPAHPSINTTSNKQQWVIGYAAFLIKKTSTSGNSHSGKLLADYIVKGPANYGWTQTYFGPIAIKLTS